MGTYTAKTRNVGRRPRSKRLRELGGSVTINNGSTPDLDGYELLSNKVAEVDSDSTDEQYPTAKCLYDALADIATAIEWLSSVFSAIGHVHAIGDITGLQAALDGKAAADHTHSGYAASSHSHAISDITNLQTTLDGKAASNHTHSGYLTSHQTVTDKSATIGTSLTTIATIGGTDIKVKIDSYAAASHTHAISDIINLQTTLDGKAASNHTHSQYLTDHQTVTNKAATIGTSLTTIATIGGTNITAKIGSYAAASHVHAISDITNLQTTLDGKAASNHTHAITDTTGTLPINRGGTGKTTGTDACNALLNALTTGDSDPVDNDYYISQYANGGATHTTFHRRPVSKLWNYIKSKADSIYAAASHTHSQYLTAHQTVTNKAATIGTSLTTIATIGGTNITAKIGSYAAASHSHSYLPLSGGTMTGNLTLKGAHIYFAGTKATNRIIRFIDNTSDAYGNGISIGGGGQTIIGGGESADTMAAQAGNAGAESMWIGNDGNIEFYTNLQSGWAYGKKSYFDTNGDLYVNRYINAKGGTVSDTAITASKTVLNVEAQCTAPTESIAVYGLKAALTCIGTPPTNTNSAAIYASATFGYAGKFNGGVHVSATLTANSVSAATVYQTSDDRLKDYIGEFHFALADLERIPLRLFRFKADKEGKVLIGTSAQAVQKVLPEIVGSGRTASEEDTEEYLNVDYSKLAIVALDCVRQLRDEVAALRREIEELKRGR